jgi:hypothetical protein
MNCWHEIRLALTVDIGGVRVVDTRFTIAMSREPGIKAKFCFTVMAGLDILKEIAAIRGVSMEREATKG